MDKKVKLGDVNLIEVANKESIIIGGILNV